MASMSEASIGRFRFDPISGKLKPIPLSENEIAERQRAGWDKRATYWEKRGVQPADQELVRNFVAENVIPIIPTPATVLDLAAGTSSYLPSKIDNKTIAVDLSRKMLEFNQSTSFKAAADARFLPFPARIFDMVLNTFMMRYLTIDGQVAAIREMHRVARPNSHIFVLDFNSIEYGLEVSNFLPNVVQPILEALLPRGTTFETNQLKTVTQENFDGSHGNLYAFVIGKK
jgi:ubiquinone/menaquinone biosynthesis C-methylase UbiE